MRNRMREGGTPFCGNTLSSGHSTHSCPTLYQLATAFQIFGEIVGWVLNNVHRRLPSVKT